MGILKEIFNKRIEYGDYHLDCRTRGIALSNPNWDDQPRDSIGQWTDSGGGGGGDSGGGSTAPKGGSSGGAAPAADSGGNKAPEVPTAPNTPPAAPDKATAKGLKAAAKDVKSIANLVGMSPEELAGKKFEAGTLEAYGHGESEEDLTARGIMKMITNADGSTHFELAGQALDHINDIVKEREGVAKENTSVAGRVKQLVEVGGIDPKELPKAKFQLNDLHLAGMGVSEPQLEEAGVLKKITDDKGRSHWELTGEALDMATKEAKKLELKSKFKGGEETASGGVKLPHGDWSKIKNTENRAKYPTKESQVAHLKSTLAQWQKEAKPNETGANYDGQHITSGAFVSAAIGYSAAELVDNGVITEVGETDEGAKVYRLALSNIELSYGETSVEVMNHDGSYSLIIY